MHTEESTYECMWHRRDGLAFTDWPDLLQPRLRGRVAFIESPRELVGVALKTLGLSYNARLEDFDDAGVTLDQLEERLKALHRQASQPHIYGSPADAADCLPNLLAFSQER